MFNTVKKIAVTALVSIGVLATIPATANAHHRHNGGVGIEFHFGSSGHSHWRPRHGGGHTNWKRGGRWERRGIVRRCSTHRALNKAHRMGVRHARIRYADHQVIKVKGRSHGHRVRILFSRAPGCPVIRY